MKNPLIPVIFIFFILLVFYVLSIPLQKNALSDSNFSYECVNGDEKICLIGSCEGVSICKNGKYLPCSLVLKCTPNQRISCSENGCFNGFKICNSCGTGYGNCTNLVNQGR